MAIGLLALLASSASAKTVYVDDDYSADDPVAHQWRSIQLGAYDAAAGDTVVIYNGVYYENVTIWNSTISFEGESRSGVRVVNNASNIRTIQIRGHHVALRNMTIQGGYDGVDTVNGNSHNGTVDNVSIIGPSYSGLDMTAGSDWLVQNVNISGAGSYGMLMTGTAYNHTLLNVSVTGVSSYDAFQFNGVDNVRADRLYASNANRMGIYLYYSEENVISNFTVNGSNSFGIELYYGHNNQLVNGLINNSNQDGIYSYYSNYGTITNITLTNHTRANTFSLQLYRSVRWNVDGFFVNNTLQALDVNYNNADPYAYYAHTFTNAYWNSVPIIFISDQVGGGYTGPASLLYVINATGVTVNITSTISGVNHGAMFVAVHNSTVLRLNSTSNSLTNLLVRDSWDNTFGNFTQSTMSASGWGGLYVYNSGWNRFVSNVWINSAQSFTASTFLGGAHNNSVEGLYCEGWNRCSEYDGGSPDNAFRDSTFFNSYYCIFVYYGERYVVERSSFTSCEFGIYLNWASTPGVIDNATIRNSGHSGMYLYYSAGPHITSTVIANSDNYAIFATNTHYGWVQDSILENATRLDYGLVDLQTSRYWTFRNVAFNNGTNPIDLNWANGMPMANAQHDIDLTNTYNGGPIVYFTNATGASYNGPATWFGAVNSTLLNVSLQMSSRGPYICAFLLGTNNSTIRGINASDCYVNLMVLTSFDNDIVNFTQTGVRAASGGLYLWGAHGNVFRDSVWANATRTRYAAYIVGDSANNIFRNTTVTGWDNGFYFYFGTGANRIEWSTLNSNYNAVEVYQAAPVVVANSSVRFNSYAGVYFYYSSGSRVENSTLSNNAYYEIYGNNAHFIQLMDNRIENQTVADRPLVYMATSRYWTMRGNAFASSNFPFDVNMAYNLPVANAIHDIDLSNTVDGQPLVYFTNSTGGTYTGPAGFFGAANSTMLNVTITTEITGLYHGGWAIGMSNSTISGLNTNGGYINFFLVQSTGNTFVNYTQSWVRQNTYGGFVIWDSDRNTMQDSVLANLSRTTRAVDIRGSSTGNSFLNVTITGWDTGIYTYFNTGTTWVNRSYFANNYWGINVYQSGPIVISNSSVVSSTHSGVYFYYSSDSRIENTTLAGSAYYQVYGTNSHFVTIQDCHIENQTVADRALIYMPNSHYWTLRGNAFSASNFPFDVNMAYNLVLANAQHDIDTSNTVGGLPIVYLTNSTGGSYTGPVGFFGAVNSTGIDVTFTNSMSGLYHSGWALQLYNSTVRGLGANGGYINFLLARSNGNTFVNYTQTWVRQGTYGGLVIWDSNDNVIRDSVLVNSTLSYTGIEIRGTSAGNALNNTTVSGWNVGLYSYFATGANSIEWSRFTGNYYGVQVYQAAPITVANSTISGGTHTGVYLYYSSGSRFENSTLQGNLYYQINANNAHYVTLVDCVISDSTNTNYPLVQLSTSRYWTLRNVAFANSTMPVDAGWSFSMPVQNAMHDIDTSNTLNGKPIVWFSNRTGAAYTGPVGLLVAVNSSFLDITFTGQTLPQYYGGLVLNTHNSTFRGFNVSYATYGLVVTASHDNRFESLSFTGAPVGSYGALTLYASDRNTVAGGSWVNTTSTNTGIYLMAGSSYNAIANVTCSGFYICVEFQAAGSWNTVRNSTLQGTTYTVYANGASYIQLLNNTIYAGSYSIYFETNVANSFAFHNNLYQSSGGLRDRGTSNIWDAGYPAGGNFWSNGSHTDLYNGPSQSSGTPDGIVDTPQGIWGPTVDNYPLSEPWPPQIVLLSPANNSFIQPGVILYFSVSRYFDNINYSLDNGTQFNFSAPFTLNTTGWTQGQHWVRILCTDATNTSLGAYFVFTVDSVAPTVTAVTPSPGSFNDVGTPFNFSVSDPYLASNATWNNGSGPNAFSAPWSVSTAGWGEGTWNITIDAWDLAGNHRQSTFLYRLDSTFPVITLSSPANNSVVGAGTVINLDVTDTFLAQVVWSNGGPFTALSSPYDISMGGWASGTYNVTVVSTDAAMHQTVRVYTFTLDSVPPQIVLVSPANNTAFTSGTTIDIEIVELNLQSVSYDIGYGVSTFSAPYNISTFAWPDGTYTVEVWADDTAGNTAYARFILYIDSAPPVVVPPSLGGGGLVAPGALLPFNVSDPTLQTVVVNNGSGNVTLSAPYAVNTTGWADGNYTVVVTATDAANHTTTGSVNITVDGTPPSITLTGPSPGAVVTPGTPVSLAISDPHLNGSTWDNGSGPNLFTGSTNISTAGWADGSYDITVQAEDLVGNLQTLVVTVVIDGTPPAIVLNAPTDGATINAGDTLDLSVTDTHLVSATWDNGSGAVAFASPFDINTTGWAGGTFTVRVWAQDSAGNQAWLNFTITIDTAPPLILLVSPTNGSFIRAGTALVFNITDSDLVSATWNNGSGAQAFSGSFQVDTAGWSDGQKTLTITATDGAGNVAVASFAFTFDSTPPALTLITPSAGSYIKGGTTLDLTVSDTNLASATWDNGSGAVTFTSPFDISTAGWPDGSTSVSVRAVDLAGNIQWLNFTVTFDSTPPAISLSSPANQSFFSAGTSIVLSVTDANLNTATWNNGSGPNAFAVAYTVSTTGWSDNTYTLTVTASDLAGNTQVRSYTFTVDSTLPSVTLASPSPGAVVRAGTTIDLNVADAYLVGAWWSNGSGTQGLAAPYDIVTTGWPDGVQSISVWADDQAGNRQWLNFTVTIDSTAPSVTLISPANNSFIKAGTPILFNISDLTLVSATWNNVTSGDLPFAVNFSVPTNGWFDRHYNITVRATDAAGNMFVRVFHFIIDSTPPQLLLVSPANNSWMRAGALIDFTIQDLNALTVNLTGSPTAFTGSYDLDTTTWPDGNYTLQVRAFDPAGNNVSLTTVFHIDSTPPSITPLTAPGAAFDAGQAIRFQVADMSLVQVQWRNVTGGVFGPFPTNFSLPTAGWPDGPVSIVVQARDAAGNTVNRTFNYTVDSTPPALSVASPSDWGFVRSSVPIVLRVVDTTSVSVEVFLYGNNVSSSVMPGPNGTWVVPLAGQPEGVTSLFVRVRDAAGHTTTIPDTQFVIDNTAPLLPGSLVWMSGNEDANFTFRAVATDALSPLSNSSYQWTFDPKDRFQSNITLGGNNATWVFDDPGMYNITLTVTDSAGNQNTTNYNITIFDITPPNVTFAEYFIAWVEDIPLPITQNTTDNSNGTLNWTWSAPGTNLTSNGPNITWVFPTPGVYNVTLVVTDPAGNQAAGYVTVDVADVTAPDVEMVGPTVVDLLQAANFTVNVTDNDPRTSYANWTILWEFTNTSGTYSYNTRNASFVTNAKQPVTVRVTVTDASGNSQVVQRPLEINVPPLVVGGGPPTANVSEDWEWTIDTFDVENGGPVQNITLVVGPDGMTIDGDTLHWNPQSNQTGPQNVTIALNDGTTTVYKTFTLYVGDPAAAAGNHAPYFTSQPFQDARVNFEYVYRFEARDDDPGQTLQYFLAFASEDGFRLDPVAQELRWFPPWHPVGDEPFERNVSISLIAFDGYAYDNQTFVIRFRNPPNQWPVHFSSAALPDLGINESYSIQISRYWDDPDDPLASLNFVVNGTFEQREAVAGKVDWYVDRSNPLDPQLVITARQPGDFEFILVARDPSGGTSDDNTFAIHVGSRDVTSGSQLPWWLILLIVAAAGAALVGVAVAVSRSRAATVAAESASRVAQSALETASKIPQAVVQPAEPLPAKGTKKDTYVVEALFIIYDDVRLIYSKTDISEVKFEDPELVASMFSAVQSFIKDSFQQTGELDRLGFGENTIMIERGHKVFMAAVIFGQPTEDLRDGMKETLSTIENAYAGIIEDWDGSTTSLEGIEGYVLPFLATTGHLTRKDVELALTEKGVKMVSQLEFFQGFVRLKCGVKNDTDSVITKVTVSIDYNEDVLRLHHIEPDTYKRQGSEVQMGVLNPQEKASLAYYFDPQICTESMIDGIARYRDSKGAVHSVNMKTRKAEVVCPIFFTKEHANTAMLKRLVEGELDQRDSKVYSVENVPEGMTWKDIFGLLKDVVLSHDVHLVRDFIREDPYQAEVWFYGETKVKNYKIVIRAAVHEQSQKIEFFAASTQIPAITGLLAEFNHTLQSMTKAKHPDLFIVPEFDEAVKEDVEKKSLMPKMQDAELESGETEQ